MSIVNALVAFISLCLIGFEIWVYVANPFQNGLNFVMGQASKIKTAAERKSETEEALEKDIAEAGVGVAAAAGGCGVIAVLYIISLIATCFEVLFIIYALVAHIGDPLVAWAAIALFIIGIGVGLIEGQHISKQMEAAKAAANSKKAPVKPVGK